MRYPGATYMTYQWWVGACNELTIAELDPVSNTPEYKYCACRVEKIEDQDWAERHVQELYEDIRTQMGIDTAENFNSAQALYELIQRLEDEDE